VFSVRYVRFGKSAEEVENEGVVGAKSTGFDDICSERSAKTAAGNSAMENNSNWVLEFTNKLSIGIL
jgi:hypothetical protein